MNKNQIIGAVVVLIIVGGSAFYGGMSYAGSQTPAARGTFSAGGGAGGFAGRTGARGGAAGGFTAGTIVSSGSGTISIQQQNGSSTEIVLVGPSTQILKTAAGSASDLSVGTAVTITGTANSDGSMTANSIQIRPAGMGH
ncbi:MAG TPA: hypothetical protein VMR46_01185 [Candidatus Paceibacterota bacterium]|nr:hypothetical protein [Candidatus Paceibacterota bacterium]